MQAGPRVCCKRVAPVTGRGIRLPLLPLRPLLPSAASAAFCCFLLTLLPLPVSLTAAGTGHNQSEGCVRRTALDADGGLHLCALRAARCGPAKRPSETTLVGLSRDTPQPLPTSVCQCQAAFIPPLVPVISIPSASTSPTTSLQHPTPFEFHPTNLS